MYKVEWDKETGGIVLATKETQGTLGIIPRPVFFEELDLLELDQQGWSYPKCEAPLLWEIRKQYYYRGLRLFEAKGADLCTKPTLELFPGIEPMPLEPVDVKAMLHRTADLMFVLENEAVEFIRDTYVTYARANKAYCKAGANMLDFEALARNEEKMSRKKMAIVKQDCDSFDIMPQEVARSTGKRELLSTKIDRFIASFSGGKDSQVVLDLCTRAIPPTEYEVIYSDTGYELPTSLELYKETQQFYADKFQGMKFLLAQNHEPVLNYWDKLGTPSNTHRWCCSVMKTAPLYRMLKVENNKQARVLVFDGVRAEESLRRENYQRVGKGKHTYVYNAHPILRWNAVEIYLYLFRHNLPMNPAYRVGKARVGCLICPFSTAWDDMIVNTIHKDSLQPFVDRLKKYASQVDIHDAERYISDRKWKLKPLADRDYVIPRVEFKSQYPASSFSTVMSDARQSLLSWLPALCPFTVRTTADGYAGELKFKKKVYPFEIHQSNSTTIFEVQGNPDNELTGLLRRVVYKTAYCINCEVCEVDCPSGALSIVPEVKINKNQCIHCHKCLNAHDRGCIAADCSRMITDTERKLNAKIHAYKKFGLRDAWVDEYFSDTEKFWGDNTLGTTQVDSMKAWLRDAEITDTKHHMTEMGSILRKIYQDNPILFWEITWINLSYNSYIVGWACNNLDEGQIYTTKSLTEQILAKETNAAKATVAGAATAFTNMVKSGPLGEEMLMGQKQGKEGLMRTAWNDLSLAATAYSLYRLSYSRNLSMLKVSELYHPNAEHGPYKEFRVSRDALYRKLRTLSADANRVLIAELNMGLEHITFIEEMTPAKVLELLAL